MNNPSKLSSKHLSTVRKLAVLCLVLGSAAGLRASDTCLIRSHLQRTEVDDDAGALVGANLTPRSCIFTFVATNLAPGETYVLNVGGRPEALFNANPKGRGVLVFTTPWVAKTQPLDFDPRGKSIELQHRSATGRHTVLQTVLSGPGERADASVDESALLQWVGRPSAAPALGRYMAPSNGRRAFVVTLPTIVGSNWSCYIDGIKRADFPAFGRQLLFVSHQTNSLRHLLDFDPRGKTVDIVKNGKPIFSGRFQAKARNLNYATPAVATRFIPATAAARPGGKARARWRVRADARQEFSLELDHVPAGLYELSVNGAFRGILTVAPTPGGNSGELEFSNRPDEPHELPLDFYPFTATFVVRQQGGAVFFQGTPANGAALNPLAPPAKVREALISTGLDPDASGHADYELDRHGHTHFSLEIEDVPAGAYQVWVESVFRGTLSAQPFAAKVKGEIEFSNDPEDQGLSLPLDFPSRGRLIEIRSAAGVYFSGVFGIGASATLVAPPLLLELPLFNTAVLPGASAAAKYDRNDHGRRSFEVELQDVPPGDYTLLVGGVPRATISAAFDGLDVRGQVEFEDHPTVGELPLTFDPLGQPIVIQQAGATLFQRAFPTGR